MSKYEWEDGTLVLPTKSVPAVKKAVREHANRRHEQVLTECKGWWEKNRTTSWKKFDAALERDAKPVPRGFDGCAPRGFVHDESAEAISDLARTRRWEGKPPRGPKAADLGRVGLRRYTNRDEVFNAGEATISFSGREVTWSVPENNHAVERARSHPVAGAFFSALDEVEWTRGTGGAVLGNDEYNEDAGRMYGGGGGSYVTSWYGPLGRDEVKRERGYDPGPSQRTPPRASFGW